MGSRGKILILVENLSVPFDKRVWREARALVEAGYGVSVIGPRGKTFDTAAREVLDGVAIYRYTSHEVSSGLWAYFGEFLEALVKMTWLSLVVFFREGFHVIQLCNPPDLLFLVALPYTLLGRAIVFDQHDLSPETYLSKKPDHRPGLVYKLLLIFERLTFRAADVVVSTNESYKQVAITRGRVPADRIVVVRNGPDLRSFVETARNPALRQGKPYLLFYLGIMGPQDGVDYLLRSVAYLIHEKGRGDFHLLLMGGGTELDALKAYARELEVEGAVTFAGWVSDDGPILEGLSTADVCVCPDPKTPLNDRSTLVKTLEYMALGKPMVCYDLIETRVSAGDAALYAAANSERDFGDKIAQLLDDPGQREALGAAGRERIRRGLAWDHSKPRLYEAYRLAFKRAGRTNLVPSASVGGVASPVDPKS